MRILRICITINPHKQLQVCVTTSQHVAVAETRFSEKHLPGNLFAHRMNILQLNEFTLLRLVS